MEGRCESGRGRDEVYLATFGDEEKNGLKLDDDESLIRRKLKMFNFEVAMFYSLYTELHNSNEDTCQLMLSKSSCRVPRHF